MERALTPIGTVFELEDPIMVNGWSSISWCECYNCVLYHIDGTNFLDLRDADIHWFKRDAKIW